MDEISNNTYFERYFKEKRDSDYYNVIKLRQLRSH